MKSLSGSSTIYVGIKTKQINEVCKMNPVAVYKAVVLLNTPRTTTYMKMS